jgi:hypothetical protein
MTHQLGNSLPCNIYLKKLNTCQKARYTKPASKKDGENHRETQTKKAPSPIPSPKRR